MSLEISSNTIFQMNNFSHRPSSLSSFHIHRVIGNTRVGMILTLVSNDTTLVLVSFPNSSIASQSQPSLYSLVSSGIN